MFVSKWRNDSFFLILTESMEALQGYKSGCSAASAGMGDISEQLYWGDDCKLDFKQSVEAISILCDPFLKSV
jgi:hypothetical protein